MALANLAVQQMQKRLPKVIGPTAHGVIDYCHVAFFATVAAVCWKSNRRAAVAAAGTSALVLGQSLLTDYKLGVSRVLPFSVHGQLDASFSAFSLAIPRIFGFENTRAANIFRANAFVEAAVVGLTDWNDGRAQAEER